MHKPLLRRLQYASAHTATHHRMTTLLTLLRTALANSTTASTVHACCCAHSLLTLLRTALHYFCTTTTATAGADIAAVCTSASCQRSILHYAALGGSAALIKALLSRGANAAALDSKNCLPLHCACARGHLEWVRLCAVGAVEVIDMKAGSGNYNGINNARSCSFLVALSAATALAVPVVLAVQFSV
eukprot:6967-Heterococcus_DN1.PRE.2